MAQARPLMSRLDRHMRALADGETPESESLLREMLYALARTKVGSRRIQEIRHVWQLEGQIPEYGLSGTLEYDMSTLQPVLDDMKRRLSDIEDLWARYTSGEPNLLTEYRDKASQLKTMSKDLGAYRAVRLLEVVVLIASRLPDPFPRENETLMLEMGAAFLLLESLYESFTNPPPDVEQQVTVMVGWLLDAVKPVVVLVDYRFEDLALPRAPDLVAAIQRRAAELGGITTMLPTAEAEWVGAELQRRFGLPLWSFTLSATDANRWAIRTIP